MKSTTKICSKCLEEKLVKEFNFNSNTKDNLQSYCRECNQNVCVDYYSNLRKEESYSVYLITNEKNGLKYAGMTSHSLKRRFSIHKAWARNNVLYYPLHEAMRDFGIENFTIELLAEVSSKEEARELEKNYIDRYNTIEEGYNVRK